MGILIGRRQEQKDLSSWCATRKAELVCVYGRRRVGKTYLVDATFRNLLAFSVTGSEDRKTPTQLRVFHRALKRFGCTETAAPRDWFDAFDRLRDLLDADTVTRTRQGRRVVFLDEFPWLAGKRSDFLVAFADFWNSWASKQDDLMVIVCGSATSWIVKNLFENTGSMYNRITRRLYVAPFCLRDAELMLEYMNMGWSRDTVLKAYMVFGGLPYYLEMLDNSLSLAQNVDALCLNPHAPLRDEVPRLMEATLSASPVHRDVLQLLAQKKAGVHRTDLAASTGTNGSSLTRTLSNLEKCGYIRKYANIYEKYQPSIYQLVDPFLLFSFHFLNDGNVTSWSDFEGTPAYYAWRGNAFEMVAGGHIQQVKNALGIASVQTRCFPWSSSTSAPGAQVDLVIERKDGVVDLCEMKCTDAPFAATKKVLESLQRKRDAFRGETGTNDAVHLVLVCSQGLKEGALPEGIAAVVHGDDLFAF